MTHVSEEMPSQAAAWSSTATGGYSAMSGPPATPNATPPVGWRERLSRIGTRVTAALQRIPVNDLLQVSVAVLTEFTKHYRQRVLHAFTEADLWIAPSMPQALVVTVADLLGDGNRRSAYLTLWNHYARNDHARLAQAIERWWDDPEFESRKHIIEQALTAHRQKLYAASIPTLLSQVEGIANHIVHTTEKLPKSGKKAKLGKTTQVIKHLLEITSEDGGEESFLDVLRYVHMHAAEQFITEVSYEETDFTSEYERLRKRTALNRHAILHGIQIHYPSALNSLRCFLLLDYLDTLCRKLAQEGTPPP